MYLSILIDEAETSRGAGAQSMTVNRLVVGSIPTGGNKIFIYIYLYFYFFVLTSRQKRGVEFCLSTRNASRIRRKVGNRVP